MQFKGIWNIEGTDETLRINGPIGEDQYTFEFSDENKGNEKVSIFLSNDRYARLARSKVYGRADVFILNGDTFLIDEVKFVRVK